MVHPFLFVYLPHAKISVKHSSTVTSAKPSTHTHASVPAVLCKEQFKKCLKEGRKEENSVLWIRLDLIVFVPGGPKTDRQEHTQKEVLQLCVLWQL